MRKRPPKPKAPPRKCDCGCGQEFIPTRPWHKYIDENHRWNHWRQRNIDARDKASKAEKMAARIHKLVTIQGPVSQAELEARLKKIDQYLKRRDITAKIT